MQYNKETNTHNSPFTILTVTIIVTVLKPETFHDSLFCVDTCHNLL